MATRIGSKPANLFHFPARDLRGGLFKGPLEIRTVPASVREYLRRFVGGAQWRPGTQWTGLGGEGTPPSAPGLSIGGRTTTAAVQFEDPFSYRTLRAFHEEVVRLHGNDPHFDEMAGIHAEAVLKWGMQEDGTDGTAPHDFATLVRVMDACDAVMAQRHAISGEAGLPPAVDRFAYYVRAFEAVAYRPAAASPIFLNTVLIPPMAEGGRCRDLVVIVHNDLFSEDASAPVTIQTMGIAAALQRLADRIGSRADAGLAALAREVMGDAAVRPDTFRTHRTAGRMGRAPRTRANMRFHLGEYLRDAQAGAIWEAVADRMRDLAQIVPVVVECEGIRVMVAGPAELRSTYRIVIRAEKDKGLQPGASLSVPLDATFDVAPFSYFVFSRPEDDRVRHLIHEVVARRLALDYFAPAGVDPSTISPPFNLKALLDEHDAYRSLIENYLRKPGASLNLTDPLRVIRFYKRLVRIADRMNNVPMVHSFELMGRNFEARIVPPTNPHPTGVRLITEEEGHVTATVVVDDWIHQVAYKYGWSRGVVQAVLELEVADTWLRQHHLADHFPLESWTIPAGGDYTAEGLGEAREVLLHLRRRERVVSGLNPGEDPWVAAVLEKSNGVRSGPVEHRDDLNRHRDRFDIFLERRFPQLANYSTAVWGGVEEYCRRHPDPRFKPGDSVLLDTVLRDRLDRSVNRSVAQTAVQDFLALVGWWRPAAISTGSPIGARVDEPTFISAAVGHYVENFLGEHPSLWPEVAIPWVGSRGRQVLERLISHFSYRDRPLEYLETLLARRLAEFNRTNDRRLSLDDFERARSGFICRRGLFDELWSQFPSAGIPAEDAVAQTAVIRAVLKQGGANDWHQLVVESAAEHAQSFGRPFEPGALQRIEDLVAVRGPVVVAEVEQLRGVVHTAAEAYFQSRLGSGESRRQDWAAADGRVMTQVIADFWTASLVQRGSLDVDGLMTESLGRHRRRAPDRIEVRLAVATLADFSRWTAQRPDSSFRQEVGNILGVFDLIREDAKGLDLAAWWACFQKTAGEMEIALGEVNSLAALRLRVRVLEMGARLVGHEQGGRGLREALALIPEPPAPPPVTAPAADAAADTTPAATPPTPAVPESPAPPRIDWDNLSIAVPAEELYRLSGEFAAVARGDSTFYLIYNDGAGLPKVIGLNETETGAVHMLDQVGGTCRLPNGDEIISAQIRIYGDLQEATKKYLSWFARIYADERLARPAAFFYFCHRVQGLNESEEVLFRHELQVLYEATGDNLDGTGMVEHVEATVATLIEQIYPPEEIRNLQRLADLMGDYRPSSAAIKAVATYHDSSIRDRAQMLLDVCGAGMVNDETARAAGAVFRDFERTGNFDAAALEAFRARLIPLYPAAVAANREAQLARANMDPALRTEVAGWEELFHLTSAQLAICKDAAARTTNPLFQHLYKILLDLNSSREGALAARILAILTFTPPSCEKIVVDLARRAQRWPEKMQPGSVRDPVRSVRQTEVIREIVAAGREYRPVMELIVSTQPDASLDLWHGPLMNPAVMVRLEASAAGQPHPELRLLRSEEIRTNIETAADTLRYPSSFRVPTKLDGLGSAILLPARGVEPLKKKHPGDPDILSLTDVRGVRQRIDRMTLPAELRESQFFVDQEYFLLVVAAHPESAAVLPMLIFLSDTELRTGSSEEVLKAHLGLISRYGGLTPAALYGRWNDFARDVQTVYAETRPLLVRSGIDPRFAEVMAADRSLGRTGLYWKFFQDVRLASVTTRLIRCHLLALGEDVKHPGTHRVLKVETKEGELEWDAVYLDADAYSQVDRNIRLTGSDRARSSVGSFGKPRWVRLESQHLAQKTIVPKRRVTEAILFIRQHPAFFPANYALYVIQQMEGEIVRQAQEAVVGLAVVPKDEWGEGHVAAARRKVMALYYRDVFHQEPPEGDV